ncbi:MAG: hypothetical protein L0G27_00770 [Paracoccus sp. (in: a-proteobacteria)]|nr:hypothetical protein [Paracoccus sp. (in: a-proteobacteria)]
MRKHAASQVMAMAMAQGPDRNGRKHRGHWHCRRHVQPLGDTSPLPERLWQIVPGEKITTGTGDAA